jgi:two-component system KDP operon response regulator KdpE
LSALGHILVIDDEPQIRRFLRAGLGAEGYRISEAASGGEGLAAAAKEKPDLVVLDLGLPDMDGLEVLQALRGRSLMPVIVLSIRAGEPGKVAALDHGADDYVTKPFGMDELLARVRAALRHRLQREGEAPVFRAGELAVDLVRRRVILKGDEIKLSAREYDLLRLLVLHAGKVLTHGFILREIWGPAHVEDLQYLRVYIRHLRAKLEQDPTRPDYLLTEIGVGYRLRPAD